jgi:hypothetical protein
VPKCIIERSDEAITRGDIMQSTKRIRRDPGLRHAALVAATGLVCSAAMAAAPVAAADRGVGEFEIWNLSSADIKLAAYLTMPPPIRIDIPTKPAPGTVVKPGHSFRIDVPRGGGYETPDGRTIPQFTGRDASAAGQAQIWKVQMTANNGLTINCEVQGSPPPAKQTAACGSYIGTGGNVATLADGPDGTTITVPASDKAKQAEIDQSFCHNPYKVQLSITCNDGKTALDVYAGWSHWILLK